MAGLVAIATMGAIAALSSPSAAATVGAATAPSRPVLPGVRHIVVIYEENHSFDNLYGTWGRVNGQPVDGLARAARSGHVTQVAQDGTPYTCLLQVDVNLTSPPLPATCSQMVGATTITSNFSYQPFDISDYITPQDTTCPAPGVFAPNGVLKGAGQPGGCTRDLVHRFYQEQYQIDGGRQDRYVTGSDAVGLTMGHYDTRSLPVYAYLHSPGAPRYVVADRFFQGAFGGSFLNHQWLISGEAPTYLCQASPADCAATNLHSVLDTNRFPNTYPLYTPTATVTDGALTQACDLATTRSGVACGDYAVNTMQPYYQPYSPGTAAARRLLVDDTATPMTIGDQLSDAGVSWAWYSGGWDNAAGNVGGGGWTNGTTPGTCTDPQVLTTAVYPNCPDKLFQFHHQPFVYFSRYAPDTPGRAAHLKDEADFMASAHDGTLPAVSFVKPIGEENEHPGYTSEHNGSRHLVDLLQAIESGPDAASTLVVVTYDEFGGQWDHVSPPGQGGRTPGPTDQFGPGTRIPALILGTPVRRSTVDHTSYDTTSIIATIERQYLLPPLSPRAARVNDLRLTLDDD